MSPETRAPATPATPATPAPAPGAGAGRLRRRFVVGTALVGSLLAVLATVVVHQALERSSEADVDRTLRDRSAAVVAAVDEAGDPRSLPAAVLGPGVAVYDASGRLVAGAVPPAQEEEFGELAGASSVRYLDVGVDDHRLLAEPTDAGGTVVVSEAVQPYEAQERTSLLITLGAAFLLVLVATAVAAVAGRRALAPVELMARTAEEWSARDLDRRFDLGPPDDEVRALGHTLDQLLDRVARAITDEQRLTSELAHELRTPLTSIQATVEVVALRGDLDEELRADLDEVLRSCRTMGRVVTELLELARTQAGRPAAWRADPPGPGGRRTPVAEVLAEVRRQVGGPVELDVDPGLEVAVPAPAAVRALAPVVENAVRHGRAAHVVAVRSGRDVLVTVHDEGPGPDPALGDDLFEPGVSGRGGSGLGLALARRVARSVGGDVVQEGAAFTVVLPGG